MLKKRKLSEASIPTSSMADIAFLLLIFFLVATVIDVDTGIGLTLPEYIENPETVEVPKDRMAALLINETGDVLLDGQPISLFQIKNTIKPRIQSKIDLPSNKKLIVSLKTDRKTVYNAYVQALDQVKMAFFEVRDEYSNSRFGNDYDDLAVDEQKEIKDAVPIIISIAEPEKVSK
ncbi:MAG: biopolymer transporter ExbD [Ignavibacteria bacterium]|nr:biopolymer transporter ExbD [Ignavibacteria bacterium]MBT8381648.1 biopolymer transporter ExbD [Ignavibacteria bacterium]MBT8391197.1 biopolymer transporter ExbD [Ignavibacteria bacterium]NNJ53139.1 biopolymer transporter ExbD [Ignavibacteriaceae bacterium]NNL19767.1 biopolymer transporter ExbD [Ignavibacteriaceae bacterium]